MRNLLLLVVVSAFFSCSSKKEIPEGILPPQKMEPVLWDYLRADAYSTDYLKRDSTVNDTLENLKLQQKVFAYYKISREDFYRSYDYYIKHSGMLTRIIDSMLAKQNRKKPGYKLMEIQ